MLGSDSHPVRGEMFIANTLGSDSHPVRGEMHTTNVHMELLTEFDTLPSPAINIERLTGLGYSLIPQRNDVLIPKSCPWSILAKLANLNLQNPCNLRQI